MWHFKGAFWCYCSLAAWDLIVFCIVLLSPVFDFISRCFTQGLFTKQRNHTAGKVSRAEKKNKADKTEVVPASPDTVQ